MRQGVSERTLYCQVLFSLFQKCICYTFWGPFLDPKLVKNGVGKSLKTHCPPNIVNPYKRIHRPKHITDIVHNCFQQNSLINEKQDLKVRQHANPSVGVSKIEAFARSVYEPPKHVKDMLSKRVLI